VFNLLHRNDESTRTLMVVLQNDLKQVGINVELRALEWGTFLDRLDANPPDLFYLGWLADYPDPENYIEWLFHGRRWGKDGNHTHYLNPEVDRLCDEARATMDQAKRFELLNQAEKLILKDLTWVLLDYRLNAILVHEHVTGVRGEISPLDVDQGLGALDFTQVGITR
jgi:ABC-type transport system substrate-binding protein